MNTIYTIEVLASNGLWYEWYAYYGRDYAFRRAREIYKRARALGAVRVVEYTDGSATGVVLRLGRGAVPRWQEVGF